MRRWQPRGRTTDADDGLGDSCPSHPSTSTVFWLSQPRPPSRCAQIRDAWFGPAPRWYPAPAEDELQDGYGVGVGLAEATRPPSYSEAVQ